MIRSVNHDSLLEAHFACFRENIIGIDQTFLSPHGEQKIIYADWTATARAYRPIESHIQERILPFIANTHTGTTYTGNLMSAEYKNAGAKIKQHVGANDDDILIFCGSGMTAAVNKLQRLLGWKLPVPTTGLSISCFGITDEFLRPVVFVTHMEHHSNYVSWLETIADVEIIRSDDSGNVSLLHLEQLLTTYQRRKYKVASVTACSNVTGIETPYHNIARIIHRYGGLCFVDFACSAPYVDINMHPTDGDANLDAVYFSGHKFLGGAGTPGILIFNKSIYKNCVPDCPGGGTLLYANPWKTREYVNDIEEREDGGTPPFLGAIKIGLCIDLKEKMGVNNMLHRKQQMLAFVFHRFSLISNIRVLQSDRRKRLGIISFIIIDEHHDLVVKILNDRFGIQTRGGCSCAGPYGHHLLNIDENESEHIRDEILSGNLRAKPGWIRLSIHPTTSDKEIAFIMDAIESTAANIGQWAKDYFYDAKEHTYLFRGAQSHTRFLAWLV